MTANTVFCTSIPKSGKNILSSFYFALGLGRTAWPDGLAALHNGFRSGFQRGTYTFPAVATDETATRRILNHLVALAPGTVAHHHFLPHAALREALARARLPAVFVYRHPRDVLVSMVNYARVQHSPEHVAAKLASLDDDAAFALLLRGDETLAPFADYFNAYAGWRTAPGVASVRFEDLIGERGGGDDEAQRAAAITLGGLIDIAPDEPSLAQARARMFNPQAGTFFRGQIGAWRAAFSPAVMRLYEREAGGLDAAWGYAS